MDQREILLERLIKSLSISDQIKKELFSTLRFELDVQDGADIDYAQEAMSSNYKHFAYIAHNNLVKKVYGEADDFHDFYIPENLQKELKILLDHALKTDHITQNKRPGGPLWVYQHDSDEVPKKLDENIRPFSLTLSPVILKLHNVIRSNISAKVKSPFSIVNTRAWTTNPKSESFGPNSLHKDGFYPGLLKIMVYVTCLSREFGQFSILGNTITNKKPGYCVCFKNSEIEHSGIPGTMFQRICFEVTIQRTFIDCEQFHSGHPSARFYLNCKRPYEFKASQLSP